MQGEVEVAELRDQEGVAEEVVEGMVPRLEGGVELGEVEEQTLLHLALQFVDHH